MRDETLCLHSGYTPKNGEPCVFPIVQSTTYKFDSTSQMGNAFDMPVVQIYSRFTNPTNEAVERKIADLESGVAAMLTTSGQAATLLSIMNLCNAGDHIICVAGVYGGTVNLFKTTLPRYGIDCTFVEADADEETLRKIFLPNKTKAFFGETIANPSLTVLDIEKFSRIAHELGVPLIIDNTFATPILCKPFLFGADIVIHSTSKYMDGHALQVGGVIVDSGRFDWANGNFPSFTKPDESYHGMVYVRDFGKAAYIAKARAQLMRDLGVYPSAHSAFLLNIGLETLALRMERYCYNALAAAEFFNSSDKVVSVNYPMLPGSKYYETALKYVPKGAGGVVSVSLQTREKAAAFLDALKLARLEVHVADIRTCVLHPATSTHRQLSDDGLKAAGVHPGLVRFSVGLEHIDDIIADAEQALNAI